MRRSIRTTGRILLAILFLGSGATKLVDPAGTQAYMAAFGLPMTQVLFGAAVVTELGGGLALLLGWRPRLVALGLAGFLLTATLIFHPDFAKQQQLLHVLKNIAIIGGLLLVMARGAGIGESADASEPLAARAG